MSDYFERYSLSFQKVTIVLIAIILLLIVSLVVIEGRDRYSFYKQVKAIEEMATTDSIISINQDAIKIDNVDDGEGIAKCLTVDEILKIYESSSGLLTANGLTYVVTLIIALLAALLLYRIQEVGALVRKNKRLEDNVKLYYEHAAAYNEILTRLESIYDLTIIVSSLTVLGNNSDSTQKENLYAKIGSICSRMSIILDKVEDSEKDIFFRSKGFEKNEIEIMETYISDTQDELERVSDGLIKEKAKIHENVDSIKIRLDIVETSLSEMNRNRFLKD